MNSREFIKLAQEDAKFLLTNTISTDILLLSLQKYKGLDHTDIQSHIWRSNIKDRQPTDSQEPALSRLGYMLIEQAHQADGDFIDALENLLTGSEIGLVSKV